VLSISMPSRIRPPWSAASPASVPREKGGRSHKGSGRVKLAPHDALAGQPCPPITVDWGQKADLRGPFWRATRTWIAGASCGPKVAHRSSAAALGPGNSASATTGTPLAAPRWAYTCGTRNASRVATRKDQSRGRVCLASRPPGAWPWRWRHVGLCWAAPRSYLAHLSDRPRWWLDAAGSSLSGVHARQALAACPLGPAQGSAVAAHSSSSYAGS
jgi:hypothetical protein